MVDLGLDPEYQAALGEEPVFPVIGNLPENVAPYVWSVNRKGIAYKVPRPYYQERRLASF